MLVTGTLLGGLLLLQGVTAHIGAHANGMYCRNGLQSYKINDDNAFIVVQPLTNLPFDKWWLHGDCKIYPPPDGEFLDLPAGGSFTVELATNRAHTTLSQNGKGTSDWPNGQNVLTDDYNKPDCIVEPNLHTQNKSMAAGTAFAIAYKSDIFAVQPGDLTVFSIVEHTPWKRVTRYQVPRAMPRCPPGGCICAWGWVPNGCGESNIYQNPFRCRVTGSTSTTKVGSPRPPVWCKDDPSKCVKGPKQMVYWKQLEGNNIESEISKSPCYNKNLGFSPGAQNDIFEGEPSSPPPPTSPHGSPASTKTRKPSHTPSHTPSYTPSQTTTTLPKPNNSSCMQPQRRHDPRVPKRNARRVPKRSI